MTRVFADTWYYLALLNPNERGHTMAVDWSRSPLRVLTTEYILLELGNALSPLPWRPRFVSLAQSLRQHSATTLLPTSPALLESGLTLFSQRPDKTWSLTDCISFAVMRDHDLHDALTADAHFQQAGFGALLLESR